MNYYTEKAVSNSQVNDFWDSSMKFWRRTPLNPEAIIKEDDSDAQAMGKLTHMMMLEPDKVKAEVFEYDFGVSRRNKKYTEFRGQSSKLIVSPKEMELARTMQHCMFNNKLSDLLKGGVAEEEYYWDDPATGLKLKSKLDYVTDGTIIDYKTTKDIEGFMRHPQTYGYHRQAAMYCEAFKQKTGHRPDRFIFLVQSKVEPTAITAREFLYEDMVIGWQEIKEALQKIQMRHANWLETSDETVWYDYPQEVLDMCLPAYYKESINDRIRRGEEEAIQ